MTSFCRPLLLAAMILGLTRCHTEEIGNSKDVSQDRIYQEYTIDYAESDSTVDIRCRFRFSGPNGTTLVLNEPSKVELDGRKLNVDSSKSSGAYYAAHPFPGNFYGSHTLKFTDRDGRNFENSFSFYPFRFNNPPAAAKKTSPLNIRFTAVTLREKDRIELRSADTDSSFSFELTAKDTGMMIRIPASELQRQKNASLMLEATLYRDLPLERQTAEGGSITMRYALRPVKINLRN